MQRRRRRGGKIVCEPRRRVEFARNQPIWIVVRGKGGGERKIQHQRKRNNKKKGERGRGFVEIRQSLSVSSYMCVCALERE